MKDDRTPEELNQQYAETFEETGEDTASSNGTRQIIKYAAAWVGIVALFFAINTGVKAYTASKNQAAVQDTYGSASVSGQPVANTPGANGTTNAAGGCGGACCNGTDTSAGGTTNSAATSSTSANGQLKKLEQAAIDWYIKNYGDSNVTAEAKDFGCHQQINIIKDGKVVKELEYRNGQLNPLTPW